MTPEHHQGVVGDGRSNAWHAAVDERSNGWPLGLHPLNVRARPLEHHLRFSDAASFFISTPSITSESSSDLDTESTGSFFPEKSTTLGSLIGIHSNSQTEQHHAVVAHQLLQAERTRRRSMGGGGGASSAAAAAAAVPAPRSRSWCPLMGCGGGSHPESIGMSSSLAHLLEIERRATTSQRQASNMEGVYRNEVEEEGISIEERVLHRNTLFDNEGILPPHPSGAPLKLILQHTSPSSSYLSADWNVFNGRNAGLSHHHHHHRGEQGPSHGRFPTFWPAICGRLSTSLAG